MTVAELAILVHLTVDCGCCAIDVAACLRVAEFIHSQYTTVELQDEEVMELRIRTMMDDLYNYDLFTGRVHERATS
jgi:hypothetical protein